MGYLAESDYTISIATTALDEILTQAALTSGLTNDQIRTNAELTAQAQISAYMSSQFQMSLEFQRLSTDPRRDRLIMMLVVNISLYHIHYTIAPRDIPEMRQKAYDEAIEMLKAFMDGKLVTGVPRVPNDQSAGAQRFEVYSDRKFISKQFDDPNLLNPEVNNSGVPQNNSYYWPYP